MAEGRVGRVVVVGNLKGGTGKSTLAVNVACVLAERGRRVALLDADPQATAAEWVARGALPIWSVHLPVSGLADTELWRKQLEALRLEHDVVVVDLPAVVTPVLAAAFLFATLILIPTSTGSIEIAGTRRVLRYIEAARKERPHRPPLVMVVPSRIAPDASEADLAPMRLLGEVIGPGITFDPIHDQAFARAGWSGQIQPGGRAAGEVQALVDRVEAILERGVEALGTRPGETAQPEEDKRRRPRPKVPASRAPAAPQPAWWRRILGD